MKHLNQFITEYIIKKKLDKPIDSEHNYKYFPKTKQELAENIEELLNRDIYDFNCIDTSEITDMSNLFKFCKDYINTKNFDVSEWNVSNVKNMKEMFLICRNFNCDLSSWDISKVYRRVGTFHNCTSLKNKPIWYQE